jgi:hypothetical protein
MGNKIERNNDEIFCQKTVNYGNLEYKCGDKKYITKYNYKIYYSKSKYKCQDCEENESNQKENKFKTLINNNKNNNNEKIIYIKNNDLETLFTNYEINEYILNSITDYGYEEMISFFNFFDKKRIIFNEIINLPFTQFSYHYLSTKSIIISYNPKNTNNLLNNLKKIEKNIKLYYNNNNKNDINIQNLSWNILNFALLNLNSLYIIKFLLESGSKVNIRDNGLNSLDIALLLNYNDVIILLREYYYLILNNYLKFNLFFDINIIYRED